MSEVSSGEAKVIGRIEAIPCPVGHKETFDAAIDLGRRLVRGTADCRARSNALTKLEEAVMWYCAAVRESCPQEPPAVPLPPAGTHVNVAVAKADGPPLEVQSVVVAGHSVDGRLVVDYGRGVMATMAHVTQVPEGATGWVEARCTTDD